MLKVGDTVVVVANATSHGIAIGWKGKVSVIRNDGYIQLTHPTYSGHTLNLSDVKPIETTMAELEASKAVLSSQLDDINSKIDFLKRSGITTYSEEAAANYRLAEQIVDELKEARKGKLTVDMIFGLLTKKA